MKNNKLLIPLGFPAFLSAGLFAFSSSSVSAMESLGEQELGAITGRDGVTLSLETPAAGSITIDQINWTIDPASSNEQSIRLGKLGDDTDSFRIAPIGMDGASASAALEMSLAIDTYTNSAGRSGLGLDARWSRMRVQSDSMSVSDDTRSFGAFALDSGGRFAVFGDGGFANVSTDQARVIVNVGNVDASDSNPSNWTMADPGQIFYRMGAAGSTEIQLDNFGFLFDMHQGTAGFDTEGLLVRSAPGSRTDLNLTFDVFANEANGATTAFRKTNDSIPMLLFGWRGGMEDFLLNLRPNGTWLSDGSLTGGLTASLGFNLADNFQFIIGEAGDDRSYLEFTDPVRLPGPAGRKDVEFGYLTLDAVGAGQGVGGICFGGSNAYGATPANVSGCTATNPTSLPTELIDIAPSDSGLAIIARDWGLHAYSSTVVYRDGLDSSLDVNEGWALIYTLGDISNNLYLHPKTGGGVGMDITLAIQTIGTTPEERWQNGTHLMIGDTDKDLAIGLVGSDLLFAARDMDVGLSLFNGLNFTSDEARLQLRGMFAGGDIPNMNTPVYGAYIDMNLEFDKFIFKLLPALSGEYINFGGYLSLANLDTTISNSSGGDHGHDDGSYISFAEPNFDKLDADLRLADITGDIEIPTSVVGAGGKIDLLSASAEADDKPKLRIENNLRVGAAANNPDGGAGDPLQIGRVEFGGQKLGSMIIPSARIYTSITLEQQ